MREPHRLSRFLFDLRRLRTALIGFVLLCALPAIAVPTTVVHEDKPPCDPLFVPHLVDELGTGFPPDELISSTATATNLIACSSTWQGLPNALVVITNLTAIDFTDLWYVADPETGLTNADGVVNGMPAFKIDAVGVNLPLIFESILADGIFASGETWHFIIDSYTNALGLSPAALGSIGVPSGGDTVSSGSILAIPEPTTLGLVGLGMLTLAVVRRRV